MDQPDHLAGRDSLAIRSFRVVFALERRLFKVDRFRLPLAYGVPVRGIVYAAGVLLAVVLAGRLPLLGALVGLIPPPFRYVALPVALAALMVRVRVDGLPAHHAVRLWVAHRVLPRRTLGFAADRTPPVLRIGEPVVLVPDGREPALRAGVLHGAGRVALRVPVRGEQTTDTLALTQTAPGSLRRTRTLRIPHGGRVVLRPGPPPAR
jgi:hypothetical protein